MTKREKRIVDALVNCVRRGEFTIDYADLRAYDITAYHLSGSAVDYYEEQTAQFRPVEVEPAEETEEIEGE